MLISFTEILLIITLCFLQSVIKNFSKIFQFPALFFPAGQRPFCTKFLRLSVRILFGWLYGLTPASCTNVSGASTHYAISSEDTQDDGSIGHLELNTTLSGVSAAVGYIKTDKDVGAGSMLAAEGDNISPFEDGTQVYEADARTVYGSLGYTIADIELGALYGQTTYGSTDDKEKELNLTASYPITESLAASILYGDVTAELSDDDYNKVLASVEYTF